ncbi:MAG: VWA domain-containing protein [Betaproteobacteria bacterium]|nr:MAG: VWA domain-containing protein [Betaproteobacteria bacterium]
MQQRQAARLETHEGEALTLQGVRLEGLVRGTLFEVSLEQRFANPFDRHVELVYTFPLPWAAVLLGVDVRLGERSLSGTVVEKGQAEQGYEDAIAEGNTAILLEQNPDRSYTVNLGNLAPGEGCTIRLRYAQVLQFEQHGLRLVVPTVIAPRYGDPVADAGLKPHQVVKHNVLAEHPFELQVRIEGVLARARIGSPRHARTMRLDGEGEASAMVVSLGSSASLDRDFILMLDKLAQDSLTVCARDIAQPGAVSVLASFCPRVPAAAHPLAVKILVDCSGSMQGDSIVEARRALQAIIAGLRDGERFSLSRFGSTVEHRSRALWRTTAATRLAGQHWAAELNANLGGTEMEDALESTLALAAGDGLDEGGKGGAAPVDLLLITDGEIHAIDRTVAKARALGHRVFVVGIGSAPAEGVLRRLAEETGGACDFVAAGEAVAPAVLRMFARLRSQRMAALSLVWPEGVRPLWASELPRSVFDGDAVTVWAHFAHAPDGTVRLLGRAAHDDALQCIGEARLAVANNNEALSRLAVAAQVEALLQDASPQAHHALELALAYQLVGPLTHFLLIDERADADKPDDMPELVKVASMVPAGHGGLGSVAWSPTSGVVRRAENEVALGYGRAAAGRLVDLDVAHACDVPVVLRSGARTTRDAMADSVSTYDIPAFLRRGTDRQSRDPDRRDPREWCAEPHYTGLTPLGLAQWLRNHPKTEWPRSYAGLRGIGVGGAVLDWLEFVLAEGLPEAQVVESFVRAMAQRELCDVLLASTGALGRLKALAQRLTAGTVLPAQGTDARSERAEFAARLQTLVKNLRADAWPKWMFDLRDSVLAHG